VFGRNGDAVVNFPFAEHPPLAVTLGNRTCQAISRTGIALARLSE
jgi:hypothetical protein